ACSPSLLPAPPCFSLWRGAGGAATRSLAGLPPDAKARCGWGLGRCSHCSSSCWVLGSTKSLALGLIQPSTISAAVLSRSPARAWSHQSGTRALGGTGTPGRRQRAAEQRGVDRRTAAPCGLLDPHGLALLMRRVDMSDAPS